MSEHPYSPLQKSKGSTFPTAALLEDRGRTWLEASDDYLVGFVMESWGTDVANQTPAIMEMQRRLMIAIRASGDCASAQTAEVINLTNTLKFLTYALIGIGVLQIGLMLLSKGGA